MPSQARPGLETLAWVNERWASYGQKGQANLTVRKNYGKDAIRYVGWRDGGAEFSERKATGLWHTKVGEEKAVAVAEHLAEGCCLKATARLVKVKASVVRRLPGKGGEPGAAFHDE